MDRELVLERALISDADRLTEISISAFHTDVDCGGKDLGGPPGYDSILWQEKVIESTDYYKIKLDSDIIGGIIVWDQGNGIFNLMRMYLDPTYHRSGYGLVSIHDAMVKYTSAKRWWLDTPAWNSRTRPFYLKCGFSIREEKDGLLIFEYGV